MTRWGSAAGAWLFVLLGCSWQHPRGPVAAQPATTAGAEEATPSREPEPATDSMEPEADEEASEVVDDDPEEDTAPAAESTEVHPHPLDGRTSQELEALLAQHPADLGSMSIGQPNGGLLRNGIQATETPYFKPVSPSGAWSTEETLRYLTAALERVHATFPNAPALALGDISARNGGRLSPHVSHQAGRDVDIGFFYTSDARWYRRGNATNFDRARNWAFVRALITETDVEMILLDRSLQDLLKAYAESIGEDREWLEGVFRGGKNLRPILRHAPGHATHFHVRFYNPLAQETARRLYPLLVKQNLIPPVHEYLHYKAKKGDTLGKIAKRYGTSVEAIKRANQLKKSLIRERQTYLIPVKHAGPPAPPPRLQFPPRRLPPEQTPRPRADSHPNP